MDRCLLLWVYSYHLAICSLFVPVFLCSLSPLFLPSFEFIGLWIIACDILQYTWNDLCSRPITTLETLFSQRELMIHHPKMGLRTWPHIISIKKRCWSLIWGRVTINGVGMKEAQMWKQSSWKFSCWFLKLLYTLEAVPL